MVCVGEGGGGEGGIFAVVCMKFCCCEFLVMAEMFGFSVSGFFRALGPCRKLCK